MNVKARFERTFENDLISASSNVRRDYINRLEVTSIELEDSQDVVEYYTLCDGVNSVKIERLEKQKFDNHIISLKNRLSI